jgi:hypothetical protein
MAKKKTQAKKRVPSAGSTRVPASTPVVVQVKHLASAPKIVRPKRVHRRWTLSLVPEGMERAFHSLTTAVPLELHRPGAAPATDALVISTNSELTSPAAQSTASNVDEPSAAANGAVVFYTGNWYAAVSSDAGKTFKYIDAANAFKDHDPPNCSFCCDQVVHYIPQIDTFVWLLQYGNPQRSDNIQRLAFAKTADVVQGRWQLFDITTAFLGVPGAFLDFPDLAVGTNMLYVTTNYYPGPARPGSAVVRLPLDKIASGQVAARPKPFVTDEFQSFRVAQNCATKAFFAAHQDTSTLAVFSWDEADDKPTQTAVGVSRWIGDNGYRSPTPDGRRWLDRADPRLTGATLAGTELWFAWGVDAGSNQRPQPFVQIARIDSTNLTLLENINVFDPESAICYAALATNANQEVGIAYAIGGRSRYPSHVVGILTGTRRDVVVAEGERGPFADPDSGNFEWGDFLTVRRLYPNQKLFAATGYTMKGASTSPNQDATPRFVVFGRSADSAGAPTAPPPAAGAPAAGAPPGAPEQDVSRFPVVDAATAAHIKASVGVNVAPRPTTTAALAPELATKPGVERWPVKTGTDPDVIQVAPQIVPTTVEEMVSIPRPADMPSPTGDYPAYQNHRAAPVETTIWRIDATIIALKLETDGDYHLVLQGASGETMIGEIPTPRPPFVQAGSPWLANIKVARKAVDDKLVSRLSPASFVPMGDKLVPRASMTEPPQALPAAVESFTTPAPGAVAPAFKTQVPPTPARITGVGFFDKVHGQMGVSQSNGIELHPILQIEWL